MNLPLSKNCSGIYQMLFLVVIIYGYCWNVVAEDAELVPIHMCGQDDDGLIEEGCECNDEKQLIICDNVVYITSKERWGTPLSTPNINVSVTKHPIKIASFRENSIQILNKNQVLPGHEKILVELYFTSNRIKQIENGTFNEMENLEVLDLGNNRLQKIDPEWFMGAKWKLKYLNLENNSLIVLTDEVFATMPTLQSLILDGNSKLFDPKNKIKFHLGKTLHDLRNLSMNGCKLNNLTDDFFANLTTLEVLSLANNNFVTIPVAVKDLPSLLFLDLSETHITEISENALATSKNLQSFYCTDCTYLEFVADCAFCGLQNLKELDFRGCIQLSKIDEGAFGYGHKGEKLPQLEFLSIHDTNLNSLSGYAFDSSKLTEFYFGDTFWDCNCSSLWILRLNLEVTKGPKCKTPERLSGKQFMKLQEQDLCPARVRFTKLILSLFVVIIAVIITIMVWYVLTNYRIRNIFYPPELPHIGYSNLNRVEEQEQQRQ